LLKLKKKEKHQRKDRRNWARPGTIQQL